ncbi:hypothetical protein KKH23_05690, partial [Patescibacteria group bacterium]|nr:hypothetical protein [Patescibacteria group bacterium]
MEFAESTDKEKPIPKELTAFLNEVQNNLGLYPETIIYNRIKEYIPVIPRKQIAWLMQTVIVSTNFRLRIVSTRCKSGDKLACEMLDLNVNGDPYSRDPTVKKGLMGLFIDENNIDVGKLLVEIGQLTQEQYDKEIRSRKSGDLIDGKSYPDLLNDLAAESKKYPTADSFSMAMIMGKLESVPSPATANVYKLIKGRYKSAEDFYNAVKKGEFEIKKTEERKERMVEPEEAVSKPLVIKGVEDLELMKKEIQDKISEEKRRRLRGGGMAGEPAGNYTEHKVGENKSVRINAESYDRISKLGTLKETYDDILKRLLDCYERIPAVKEWLEYVDRVEAAKSNILRESDSSDYKTQNTIRISLNTYNRLSKLGTLADTFNSVIIKILDAC